tara:strand:- start:139 stop:300 length:162 start_codon:yes stop_codon:yes gene_type:complete
LQAQAPGFNETCVLLLVIVRVAPYVVFIVPDAVLAVPSQLARFDVPEQLLQLV